jgi:hypothetical protein
MCYLLENVMTKNLTSRVQEKAPAWAGKALQGLVFWIGHRCSLYPHHDLGESALVAETCNLIAAHLHEGESLLCEQPYRKLIATDSELGPRVRADLAVLSAPNAAELKKRGHLQDLLTAVIEVKRASASKAEIDDDLKRLAILKAANPSVRAFLFVIAEGHLPKKFVAANGKAKKGRFGISDKAAYYHVRRVCKASASFDRKGGAHFACIIEVNLENSHKLSIKNERKEI